MSFKPVKINNWLHLHVNQKSDDDDDDATEYTETGSLVACVLCNNHSVCNCQLALWAKRITVQWFNEAK